MLLQSEAHNRCYPNNLNQVMVRLLNLVISDLHSLQYLNQFYKEYYRLLSIAKTCTCIYYCYNSETNWIKNALDK